MISLPIVIWTLGIIATLALYVYGMDGEERV